MGKLIVSGTHVEPLKGGTGYSLGKYGKLMQIRSTPEQAYRLRKLIVNIAFWAPGAGYSYIAEWKVQRNQVDVDPLQNFLVSAGNAGTKSGEKSVIAAQAFADGDSYAYPGSSPGSVGIDPMLIEWDKEDAPMFIQEIYLAGFMRILYDGSPTRTFYLDIWATVFWEPFKISRKAWNELAEELASLSLR